MRSFKEADVRRHYDLLQHTPELGLTQLNAFDESHLIGVGLFDNEDDFVSECQRYNNSGILYVGVNPRSLRLLDEFGGLKNRIRSLFQDVVKETDIDAVTGIVVSGTDGLTETARAYRKDVSVLYGNEVFFPMDKPISVSEADRGSMIKQISDWLYGESTFSTVSLSQFVRVVGTSLPEGGLFTKRIRFQKYRPYILDGIADKIMGVTQAG